MIKFENYKENVDFIDKLNLKHKYVSNSVIRSHIKLDDEKKAKKRICSPPLSAAVLGLDNTGAPCYPSSPRHPELYHTWTDIDAQQLYLDSKPTCYLILSKPGAGAYAFGEALAKKLNCIHFCPKNVLTDELEQNSLTGHSIDFNMRHNGVIKSDNILPILKRKLESPAVKHRGYILSGFPLVTSQRSEQYLINSLHAEESIQITEEFMDDVILNMKKKKPRKKKHESGTSVSSDNFDEEGFEEEEAEEEQNQEEAGEEEEQVVELPKFLLDTCEDIILQKNAFYVTKKVMLLNQITELFCLEMRPDIVIYITCPDTDMVTKKNHKYLNYKTNLYTVDPFITINETELRWPTKYSLSDYVGHFDNRNFIFKYNCRQPSNFTDKATEQMCNYKQHVVSYVESKVKDYNPKYIIKLDGRTSVHQMLYHVTERLHMLSIVKPVIIPEPMYLEEPPEDIEEFWKTVEELSVIRSGATNFNRYASPWVNRCPVELKKRLSVRGKPKFAVTFFKHVYLLSSLQALISFCRNPGPYLKSYYLEPTCRFVVTGTKSSGKTMISECLSWIFDAPVIQFNKIFEDQKQSKHDSFSKSILSEIIALIEDARLATWQTSEADRTSKLDEWNNMTLVTLKKYIPLLIEYDKLQAKAETEEEFERFNAPFLKNFRNARSLLSFLPFLDDFEECKSALKTKNLYDYAPEELTKETSKPTVPVLGDSDVTQAISNYIVTNDLQKEINPTPEELVNEIIRIINNIDKESSEITSPDISYGKYVIDGFPSDPEYWGHLSEAKLLPDNTIAIIENREIEPELIQHYKTVENSIKNHHERFLLATDPLIKTKLFTKQPPDCRELDMQMIVLDLINVSVGDSVLEEEPVSAQSELIALFTQSIDKFREDWDSLKLKLEENGKPFVEVELESKSDVQVVEEVLLKLRKTYRLPFGSSEDEDLDVEDEEDETRNDLLNYNSPHFLCEIGNYCPIAYYDYGILWEGKPEFTVKYENKLHSFCKEECVEIFRKDVTKYQSYNKPFKKTPPLRICVIGPIGTGKTTVSKYIAKELGVLHINFAEILNDYLMPRHIKKVGRQYENSFTDVPIDEEAVVEFQTGEDNENLVSDILSNETELRRMVYNYLERGTSLMSVLMQKLIKKLWFEEPFLSTGFVLDGFPRLPTDVEDMITCFCIPDVVIEIEGNSDLSLERLAPRMFKTWKMQQNEAKEIAKKNFENEKKEWMEFVMRKVVIKIVIDEIIANVITPTDDPDIVPELSTVGSAIIDAHPSGSSNVDANLFNTYNELILEFPEPVDQKEWEKNDDVRERIDSRLEAIFEVEDENIQSLKDLLSEQKIKVISIDGTKRLIKVLRIVLSKLKSLRNRCESFFEQTFVVNCDIADMLLLEGFYFLSKFHYMCPVYIFANPFTTINPYKISKSKGRIFPVIHRSYVYFINGEESLIKFRTNPLKYVTCDNIASYCEFPLRIGIIGPPKSGKSALAAKLAKRYGLICISRGLAVRNILENMHWTELASRMKATLQTGDCINCDLIIKAVHTALFDYRTWLHGFVFDGFPESALEASQLLKEDLYPLIMFDCSNNRNKALENSQKECYFEIIKRKPPYSHSFIQNRFTKWSERRNGVRNYINDDLQNLVELNGNESRWQCLQDANDHIKNIALKINHFLNNVNSTIVPVDVMCISNEIFQKRMSQFKNMCPICLRKNILKHSGYPVDRKGVVQYKNKFYWICKEHFNSVMRHPERYLYDQKVHIPEIPVPVKTVNVSLVYENGICIVTYAENLPSQMIVRGINNFAANFRGITYLFCDEKCLEKFLAKPKMYYDIEVFKNRKMFPHITLNKLPDIGYLEQSVGLLLTEACCAVNVARPKYPGLSPKLSALLYIALYLKTRNPQINSSALKLYSKTFKTYEVRSRLILDIGLRLRSMDNPFAQYPKCCSTAIKSNSCTVRRVSSITAARTVSSQSLFD